MTEEKDKSYDFYVIAIVDILGQAEKLAHLDVDPWVSRESDEFKKFTSLMKDTVGSVIEFRKSIKSLNDELTKELETPEGVSKEKEEIGNKFSKINVSYDFFSDLAILSICLKGNPYAATSIVSMFSQLSLLFLSSLAKGIPLRGAIDVGQCTKMDDGDIYGIGLQRAYELERSVAEYPRIVSGNGFKEYWTSFSDMQPDTIENEIVLRMLGTIQQYIEKDTDEEYILSYLALSFIEAYGGSSNVDLVEILTMASEFIQKEIDKYIAGNNELLLVRYANIKNYFLRRDCWKV
jgi:hypothetical protein